MRLCLIRHALAGERATFAKTGRPDDERPITPAGRRNTRRSLAGLRRLLPRIDILATSPFVRAEQTAEIVATAYPRAERETVAALAPGGKRKALLEWLREREIDETLAWVGHEPDLGETAGWLLSGRKTGFFEMEKGGVALVEFERKVGPGRARLLWSIPPRALLRLARA